MGSENQKVVSEEEYTPEMKEIIKKAKAIISESEGVEQLQIRYRSDEDTDCVLLVFADGSVILVC